MKRINWGVAAAVISVAGIVVSVWIARTDFFIRSMSVRMVSQVALQPDATKSISSLQVSFNGVQLESAYLSVLELVNDGYRPVLASEFEGPIELRVQKGVQIHQAQVDRTSPPDLNPTLEQERDIAKIKPLLLNAGDSLTFSVLTSGTAPKFTPRARVVGIANVAMQEPDIKLKSQFAGGVALCLAAFLFAISFMIEARHPLSAGRVGRQVVANGTLVVGVMASSLAVLLGMGNDSLWWIGAAAAAALVTGMLIAFVFARIDAAIDQRSNNGQTTGSQI